VSRRSSRRLTRGAAGAAVVAVLLAACGQEALPQPKAPKEPGPVPVVVDAQVDRVLGEVETAVGAADQALDPAPLQPRVAGPALELRQTAYTIRRQLPDQAAPAPLGGEKLLDIAPAADGWPRFFLTATRPTPEAVPQLELLLQTAPREPYRVTSWARLLPGVTLPATSAGEPPEALPAGEPSGLVASPADVVARYADVLAGGARSQHAAAFAEDAFRAQVVGEQDAERQAVGQFFGYQVAHAPRADGPWSVRTEDGGALVVGVLDATRTFTVSTPGAKLPLPADLAVLAGRPEATRSATVTSLEVVAFQVPPEGSDAKITVLAGERGPVRVEAS
jgi:hypothetical protein